MAKTLELNFNAEDGLAKVSVRNPKEPIDPVAIKAAMEQIVLSNVFASANGKIISVKDARIIDRTSQDIVLP